MCRLRFASARSRCFVPIATSTASRFCSAAPRLYATPVATAISAPATITRYDEDADGDGEDADGDGARFKY